MKYAMAEGISQTAVWRGTGRQLPGMGSQRPSRRSSAPPLAVGILQKPLSREERGKLNKELLFAARKTKGKEAGRLLEAGADANARDEELNTPLMHAALTGWCNLGKALIGKNADVNMRNCFWRTALMIAAVSGHCEFIELLARNKVELNAVDGGGRTALDLAVQAKQFAAVDVLRALGAKSGKEISSSS